jgi:DNA-binding MarR family transcriptional regulator
MSRTLNATTSMVEWHMRKLLAAGMLTRVPGRHYDLRLTEIGQAAL